MATQRIKAAQAEPDERAVLTFRADKRAVA